MKLAIFISAVVVGLMVAMIAARASAPVYAWCGTDGAISCIYDSRDQCMMTMHGQSTWVCIPNPRS